VVAPGTLFTHIPDQGVRATPPPLADSAALVRFGTDVHRLRAALAAEGAGAVPVLPLLPR
jgi:coenzyme F420-0:L-glutamate ligase / coenzyme F420-1:gamma-L-glutamate ligase